LKALGKRNGEDFTPPFLLFCPESLWLRCGFGLIILDAVIETDGERIALDA